MVKALRARMFSVVLCSALMQREISFSSLMPPQAGIHRIGNAVFIVCGENEYRLGIGPRFHTKILSHGIYTSCQTDIQIDFPLYYNRNGEKINAKASSERKNSA